MPFRVELGHLCRLGYIYMCFRTTAELHIMFLLKYSILSMYVRLKQTLSQLHILFPIPPCWCELTACYKWGNLHVSTLHSLYWTMRGKQCILFISLPNFRRIRRDECKKKSKRKRKNWFLLDIHSFVTVAWSVSHIKTSDMETHYTVFHAFGTIDSSALHDSQWTNFAILPIKPWPSLPEHPQLVTSWQDT